MAALQSEINTAPGKFPLPGRIIRLEETRPGFFWLDVTRVGNKAAKGEIQLNAVQLRASAAILRSKADELDRAAQYAEEWERETRTLEAEQAADLATAETIALFSGHGEPTDQELCDMARWYAEREQGRFALESDALDREACHA